MRKICLGTRLFVVFVCIMLVGTAHASPMLYVSDTLSNNVAVIDTATNTVVGARIAIAHGRPLAPVVSADGSFVYVQSVDGTIAVIDAQTASVIHTFDDPNPEQPAGPASITLSPDGSALYAIASGNGPIAVVDTRTGSIVRRITGPGIGEPSPLIRVSRDGRRLFVESRVTRAITAIDATSGVITGRAFVPGPSSTPLSGMVVGRDDKTLFVSAYEGSLISIDTSSMAVLSTVPLGSPAYGVDISPDGNQVFIAASGGGCLISVDLRTQITSGTGIASNECFAVAASRDSDHAYVANYDVTSDTYRVVLVDDTSHSVPVAIPGFTYVNFDSQSIGPSLVRPEPGAWWNPAESGRAFNIEVRHGTLALIASVYDSSGAPTWFTASGPYDAVSGTFSGTLGTTSGGQCLGCPYHAPSYLPSAGGPVRLKFSSATTGVIQFDGGTTAIQKYDW